MVIKDIAKKIIGPTNLFLYHQKKQRKEKPSNEALMKNNTEFYNIHEGERCFILGNGPSVRKLDFSSLANEYVFTVNQIGRMDNYDLLKANYHVWADERFFDLHEDREEDMELLNVMKSVNKGENKPIVFYKTAAYEMINRFKLDEELNIRYYDDVPSNFASLDYTYDFSKEVPRFPTVIQYVILLAVYMGFKDIYLLGCDCTGIVNTIHSRMHSQEEMSYAYKVSDAERKRMERTNAMAPIQDELRWYALLFDNYEYLRDYCQKHGRRLYNATEPSLLYHVEHADLKTVLSNT